MPPSTLSVGMPLNKQPMHGNGAHVFASRKAATNHVYGWLHLGQSAPCFSKREFVRYPYVSLLYDALVQ